MPAQGIDVYWENVGGAVQQAVFPRLNDFARMVMCGMVAEYNDVEPRPGPNLMSAVRKRIKIEGFIVGDRSQRFAEYRAMAAPLLKSGELKYREDIVDGLDRAPEAFIGLLQGRNFGKLVVRLAADPTRRAWARRQRGGRCPRFDPACPKAACHGVGRELN
jgi:NADPH-dependent curcumin reductase CurA